MKLPPRTEKFWNDNKELFNANAESFKSSLKRKVVLKDSVAELLVYITGTLIWRCHSVI